MRPVIVHHDVAELIGIDRIPMPQFKFRVCEWLPRQLLGDLDHVVVVDVTVSAGPNEIAYAESGPPMPARSNLRATSSPL